MNRSSYVKSDSPLPKNVLPSFLLPVVSDPEPPRFRRLDNSASIGLRVFIQPRGGCLHQESRETTVDPDETFFEQKARNRNSSFLQASNIHISEYIHHSYYIPSLHLQISLKAILLLSSFFCSCLFSSSSLSPSLDRNPRTIDKQPGTR